MKSTLQNRSPRLALWLAAAMLLTLTTSTFGQVTNSTIGVGYIVDGGGTKIGLKNTSVWPLAKGHAKVDAKSEVTKIEAKVEDLAQPGHINPNFLTYVLWTVAPDGRTSNLGEILTDHKGKGKIKVTTQLQTFALIVTAEPYRTVRQPSEFVVLQNEPEKNTKGKLIQVDQYTLMNKNQYEKTGSSPALVVDLKSTSLEMYEARNAVEIAKSQSAAKYAPEPFSKAQASMQTAENLQQQKADKKEILSAAGQAMQYSEDARALSVDRQLQERIAMERQAVTAVEVGVAAALGAEEAKRVADLEAQRQAEITAAREARQEQVFVATEALTLAEAEQMRINLLAQLGRVLQVRDTPRGLVVNMAETLFATGSSDLRISARETLAKLAGILAIHPGLVLEVEGYTDSTGSSEFNRKLSERRAQSVATFLIGQGVPRDTVTSRGFGAAQPIATNHTAAGRQQNRRVEIIISGQVIGRIIKTPVAASDTN